ncbi:MAG: bifunctional nuclease family protein [Dehalococcoidia bacterium]
MRELIIDSIRVGLRHYRRVVVLREKEADRYLTIWIGADVADAIAFCLQDVTASRPQTHDLMLKVLQDLGGTVESIVVNDLKEDTFYATIHVRHGEERLEVDSRPSDAIAIAVRANVPIYVADEVMDRAGIVLDEEGQPLEGAFEESVSGPVPPTQEELEKLSAFRDFVSGLDLDDLGESGR